MVMREWSIELKDDWTPERVWEILDKSMSRITLAPPKDIPLVFRRREVQ
jgi:hypothetical protein